VRKEETKDERQDKRQEMGTRDKRGEIWETEDGRHIKRGTEEGGTARRIYYCERNDLVTYEKKSNFLLPIY
jgi:hypothetical protein